MNYDLSIDLAYKNKHVSGQSLRNAGSCPLSHSRYLNNPSHLSYGRSHHGHMLLWDSFPRCPRNTEWTTQRDLARQLSESLPFPVLVEAKPIRTSQRWACRTRSHRPQVLGPSRPSDQDHQAVDPKWKNIENIGHIPFAVTNMWTTNPMIVCFLGATNWSSTVIGSVRFWYHIHSHEKRLDSDCRSKSPAIQPASKYTCWFCGQQLSAQSSHNYPVGLTLKNYLQSMSQNCLHP